MVWRRLVHSFTGFEVFLKAGPRPNLLVLGSQGMLGHAVLKYFSQRGWNVSGTQRSAIGERWYFDAESNCDAWRPVFKDLRFDLVINCIAILKSAIQADDMDAVVHAIRVNALFPHLLARMTSERGTRVVHVSTDGVFAGGRQEPYFENDTPDSCEHYGRTKMLGESPADNVLTVRCSLVGLDAAKRRGLLEWLLQQPDGAEVSGFTNQLWNGVTTLQFARLCETLADRDVFDASRCESAIHHFCPNPIISKHDLLCLWRDLNRRNITVRPTQTERCTTRVLGSRFQTLRWPNEVQDSWADLLADCLRHEKTI